MRPIFWLCATFLLLSCDLRPSADEAAMQAAVHWAEAYFNYDFHEAARYATDESGRWLQFAASNATEQQLQLLRNTAEGATVEVDDFFATANDTLRVVTLHVNHFVAPTALGDSARLTDEALFQVTTVLRNGEWKVRMEDLPRSEKQSLD